MENPTHKGPFVSLTMITWNRREDVRESLEHVFKINYQNYEVIVVDNGSTDGVAEMIESEFPQVRLIKLPRNTRLLARNISFKNARGEYIVTLDDDSYPEPDAISKMIEHFVKDPCLGIIAFHIPCGDYFSTWDWGETSGGLISLYIGSGAGIRRKVFDDVGFYDEALGGYSEEFDFTYRATAKGYTLGHYKEIIAHHRPRYNKKRVFRFFYGNEKNQNYLMGKFIYPYHWPLLYLRSTPLRLLRSYYLGGPRAFWWSLLANTYGTYAIISGYHRKIILPQTIEYYMRYSRRYSYPLFKALFSRKQRRQILADAQKKHLSHENCPQTLKTEDEINWLLFRNPRIPARKDIFELSVKFNITRLRKDLIERQKIMRYLLESTESLEQRQDIASQKQFRKSLTELKISIHNELSNNITATHI